MRTTITLPPDLLAAAKRRAAERGTSVSGLVADSLRAELSGRERPRGAPFRLITFRGAGPAPGMDLDRTSALLGLEEDEAFRVPTQPARARRARRRR